MPDGVHRAAAFRRTLQALRRILPARSRKAAAAQRNIASARAEVLPANSIDDSNLRQMRSHPKVKGAAAG